MSYRHHDFVTNGPGVGKAIVDAALVNINENSIVESGGLVTSLVNQGVGGADYNLDTIVGTPANLRKSISDACLMYGAAGDGVSTPDSAALSIIGDLDIRFDLIMRDPTPAATEALAGKAKNTTNRAYFVELHTSGVVHVHTSPDGSVGNEVEGASTVATGFVAEVRRSLRTTLDVDDGAGNRVYEFWIDAADPDNPDITLNDGSVWDQLGTTVTTAGTTSIVDNDSPFEIGSLFLGTIENFNGSIFTVEVYDGIDGTRVGRFDAADYVNKTTDTTFPSSTTSEEWALAGDTFIQNTGQEVVHTIGGVILESTAGQLIASPGVVLIVARQSEIPSANQQFFDARSVPTSRWVILTIDSNFDRWTIFQDTVRSVPEPFDTDPHLFTGQFNADSTTKLTVSGVGDITDDAGDDDWDFGTLFGRYDGTVTMKGYSADFVVTGHKPSDKELYDAANYLLSKNKLAA